MNDDIKEILDRLHSPYNNGLCRYDGIQLEKHIRKLEKELKDIKRNMFVDHQLG